MLRLDADQATATIDPAAGGRIASLEVLGHELLVSDGDDGMQWGSFPMIPWAGRIRGARFHWRDTEVTFPPGLGGHALHGTTYTQPWEVLDETSIRCELGPSWPWPGHAVQRFELHDDRLHQIIEVHAERDAMPVCVGWHPWFRRHLGEGEPVRIDLAAEAMAERDAEGIPSGRWLRPPPPGPWDDCFAELTRPTVVRWPGVLEIEIDSTCEYAVVFDELDRGVCVEPQTDPPDVLNGEPRVVEPGAPLIATTTWWWRSAG